jgi:hypothetical protein
MKIIFGGNSASGASVENVIYAATLVASKIMISRVGTSPIGSVHWTYGFACSSTLKDNILLAYSYNV